MSVSIRARVCTQKKVTSHEFPVRTPLEKSLFPTFSFASKHLKLIEKRQMLGMDENDLSEEEYLQFTIIQCPFQLVSEAVTQATARANALWEQMKKKNVFAMKKPFKD